MAVGAVVAGVCGAEFALTGASVCVRAAKTSNVGRQNIVVATRPNTQAKAWSLILRERELESEIGTLG